MQEPSHFKAALQLVLRSFRTRGDSRSAAKMVPQRRVAVERQGLVVDRRRVAAYLRVVAGTAPTGPEIGETRPLPPTYPALWTTALALELMGRVELPLPSRGLIHLESELFHLRSLYPTDRPRCRVELDRVEDHPQGLCLTLASRIWTAGGQLCLQGSTKLLARFADTSDGPAGNETSEGAEEAAVEWREVQSWKLRSDHGRRYARVSGDFNPIHLWAWSSRPFGYRQPILHGFCTEAMVAHALTRHLLGGDPCALRRLQIRFRAPLLLPARVRLEVVDRVPASSGRFRVLSDRSGDRPVAEGEFVGSVDAKNKSDPQ